MTSIDFYPRFEHDTDPPLASIRFDSDMQDPRKARIQLLDAWIRSHVSPDAFAITRSDFEQFSGSATAAELQDMNAELQELHRGLAQELGALATTS